VAINLARYLLDTNIALYFLGGRLLIPLPVGEFYISIISEMEMLSYPAISGDEEIKIRQFLTQVAIVDVNEIETGFLTSSGTDIHLSQQTIEKPYSPHQPDFEHPT
jgi:hypothetical protein